MILADFSPFPETKLSFSTLFCRTVSFSTSRWSVRLRDFPQNLMEIVQLDVSGRLIGAEPVGIDQGILSVHDADEVRIEFVQELLRTYSSIFVCLFFLTICLYLSVTRIKSTFSHFCILDFFPTICPFS